MKTTWITLMLALLAVACNTKQKSYNHQLNFDFDWKFATGEHAGAEAIGFDDTQWENIDVPHDFSIEHPFSGEHSTGKSGGYAFSGIGWYRKHFKLPQYAENKKVHITFNGVYRNSEVWINGHYLGLRPYGYSTFHYDLTPYLNPGGENLLAVKVNTSNQPNSRWYTGSGIYRHVYLHLSNPVHLVPGGVHIQQRIIDEQKAVLNIHAEIDGVTEAGKELEILTTITGPDGKIVKQNHQKIATKAGAINLVNDSIFMEAPIFWSIDHPSLYKICVELYQQKERLDRYETKYGIRSIVFDPRLGMLVNGQRVKLKGTNNHHDGGPLGAACFDYTFERQLRILKSMGCNALRMSHNPPAPELLECADSMGFVVINEIFDEWENGKMPHGYAPHFKEWYQQDVADWIRRDRNHASVIAWSLGNEVYEQRMDTAGIRVLKTLLTEARKHDTSRPFTAACNEIPDANQSGFAELLDIVGYNYREPYYKSDHQQYPNRVIYGSETVIYPYHASADSFPLRSNNDWFLGQQADFVAGEFLWTGFDYLGESGIGKGGTALHPWNQWPGWPWRSAICGVVDLCGFEKPAYWFRKALWSKEPVVHIAVPTSPAGNNIDEVPFWGWPEVEAHWNHPLKGELLKVQVYTNCPTVELLLNGKSLGSKAFDPQKEAFLTWDVPFEEGTLEAIGQSMQHETVKHNLKTAGQPASMVLTADRNSISAHRQDVSYCKLELLDAQGTPVPFDDRMIHFSIEGAGKIAAVGNGNPQSHTPFKGNHMETYLGKCLVIVQSSGQPGDIVVSASADGLQSISTVISAVQ
ncbi:MAG: DUF4982 domain-containing protein [Prolixibacteraceae bacterium]|nr:DUF4982 domain-containing protein [Prolixibacteraceae bacterium]